jgi:hypothetical protein
MKLLQYYACSAIENAQDNFVTGGSCTAEQVESRAALLGRSQRFDMALIRRVRYISLSCAEIEQSSEFRSRYFSRFPIIVALVQGISV